jgi:hypothetical protein
VIYETVLCVLAFALGVTIPYIYLAICARPTRLPGTLHCTHCIKEIDPREIRCEHCIKKDWVGARLTRVT